MTFQQIQSVTDQVAPAKSTNEYQGVYLTGDELELLEKREQEIDALWKQATDDLD